MDSNKKSMLSLVIPVFNEQEVLKDSFARMDAAMQSTGYAYEIIYVNDGSRDGTLNQLRELAADHKLKKDDGDLPPITSRLRCSRSPATSVINSPLPAAWMPQRVMP